ncbi:MAG TPA: DNA-3-methyladenine glycosylase 2 family protein [Puia sp.]|jgi:DNA-3-methyladenine glycosylase II|nr:DNA-3-methyladenine glycosylase 2 family protein [Puia sp.]
MANDQNPYLLHLAKDRKFAKLIDGKETFTLSKRRDVYLYLCFSILSQQLSTKVADVIRKRFLKLYPSKPSPAQILATPHETLRSVGLSGAKANYIHNVAKFSLEFGMDQKKLAGMNDEEVIEYLTRIKGVGRWTVEMLLMFTLGREDIFAVDDLGIQQAMIALYKLDKSDKKKLRVDMLRISSKWSPYRSYACLHLWKHKDNKPQIQ